MKLLQEPKIMRVQLRDSQGQETDAFRKLKSLRESTGISPRDLLKNVRPGKPKGLIYEKVERCFQGKSKSLQQDYYEYITKLWAEHVDTQLMLSSTHDNGYEWDDPENMSMTEIVNLTGSIRKRLLFHKRRTACGARKLLSSSQKKIPYGLTDQIISEWLRDGGAKKARKDFIDFVLDEWESMPDSMVRLFNNDGTPGSYLCDLQLLYERTGISPEDVLDGCSDIPDSISAVKVRRWLGGHTKTAKRDHLDFVINAWKRFVSDYDPVKLLEDDSTPSEILSQLINLQHRAGIGPRTLFRKGQNVPAGLSAVQVSRWLRGEVKEARRSYVDFVLNAWRNVDRDDLETIYLVRRDGQPSLVLCKLIKLYQKTGVSPKDLIGKCRDVPDGLTVKQVEKWLRGEVKREKRRYISFVRELWEDISKELVERVEITPDIRSELIGLNHRIKMMPHKILKHPKGNKPEGLTIRDINRWISGEVKEARKEHLDFVMEQCRRLSKKVST